MKTLLRFIVKTRCQVQEFPGFPRNSRAGGFTMIELLVGAIMAFLIITPLLGFVVSILDDDRREGVKAITEDEVKSAMDSIRNDLSQAIFIYDQDGIDDIKGANNSILLQPGNSTPILVFWKRELVENGIPFGEHTIADCPGDDSKCDDTHVLSLVSYYFNNNTGQITRFSVRDGVKDVSGDYLCGEDGLADCPDDSQQRSNGFPTSLDTSDLSGVQAETGETIGGAPSALVSHIDTSTANVPDATCPDDIDEITTASNSFYACVGGEGSFAKVHIRGNALHRLEPDRSDYDSSRRAYFPAAEATIRAGGGFGTSE